ncbi:MAG: DNA recombination/repair protein RecA, partial [Oscillospiraceae bacterium]|nr:DNA recombination/repair protein RecA [Oscillospiraceae bacterium]
EGGQDYLTAHPDKAEQIEQEIRANYVKLMSPQAVRAAKAAGRAIDVTAEDFDDGGDSEE